MLCEVKIRVTTRLLGNVKCHDKIRRFSKNKQGDINLDMPLWMWAMRSALHAVEAYKDICISTIRLPLVIRTPTLVLFVDKRERMFEAVDTGTVLTFSVVIAPEPPPPPYDSQGSRSPTLEEFRDILNTAGQTVGFSSCQGDVGLGRFKVESVTHTQPSSVIKK